MRLIEQYNPVKSKKKIFGNKERIIKKIIEIFDKFHLQTDENKIISLFFEVDKSKIQFHECSKSAPAPIVSEAAQKNKMSIIPDDVSYSQNMNLFALNSKQNNTGDFISSQQLLTRGHQQNANYFNNININTNNNNISINSLLAHKKEVAFDNHPKQVNEFDNQNQTRQSLSNSILSDDVIYKFISPIRSKNFKIKQFDMKDFF